MTASLPDTLATMAKSDPWALQELVRYHQRMIAAIANRFGTVAQSMGNEDLRQECVIGMIELLSSWKPGAGNSFSTHCFAYLPHRVRRRLDTVDSIVKLSAREAPALRKRYQETGKPNQPIAVSMYKPSRNEGMGEDEALLDEIESTSNQVDFERRYMARCAVDALDRLPAHEREIVTRVTFNDETFQDVATDMGVSRQYVHASYKRALDRLKKMV